MPKKKKRRRRHNSKIPLATVGGLAGTLMMPNRSYPQGTLNYLIKGEVQNAVGNIIENVSGVNIQTGEWNWDAIAKGLTPAVVGALISKFVGGSPINLNQRLKDVPYIKI